MTQMKKLGATGALLGAALCLITPLGAAEFTLENDQVALTCVTKSGQLLPGTLRDIKTGQMTIEVDHFVSLRPARQIAVDLHGPGRKHR